jgi:hypothetical protein
MESKGLIFPDHGYGRKKNKYLLTDRAKEWFAWLETLNENCEDVHTIYDLSDIWDDLFKLCNMVASGEITVRQFYANASQFDFFCLDQLGPEYSDLKSSAELIEKFEAEREAKQ